MVSSKSNAKKKSTTRDYEKILLNDTKKIQRVKHNHNLNLENVESIWDIFCQTSEKNTSEPFCGRRRRDEKGVLLNFSWESYGKARERIDLIACGIKSLQTELDEHREKVCQSVKFVVDKTIESAIQKATENGENENINENEQKQVKSEIEIKNGGISTDEKAVKENKELDENLIDKKEDLNGNSEVIKEKEMSIEKDDNSKELNGDIKEEEKSGHIEKEKEQPQNDKSQEDWDKTFERYTNDPNPRVGIYSVNRPEWIETSLALQSMCFTPIPLYDTFGKDSLVYILKETKLNIIVSSPENVGKCIEAKRNGGTSLKVIVQMDVNVMFNNLQDDVKKENIEKAESAGLQLIGLSDLIKNSAEKIDSFERTKPRKDNLAYIMYTSGTSGNPKGVMLSHQNALSVIKNSVENVDVRTKGPYLSYLPLAHIFETAIELLFILLGYPIGYYSGDIKRLSEDIVILQPYYFAAVPRVIEKLHGKLMQNVAEKFYLRRLLFNFAYKKGVEKTRSPEGLLSKKFMDSLLWDKIRKKIGFQNLKLIMIGGSPIPTYLMEFLRVLLTAKVHQGYGLTETYAVVSMTQENDPNLGHVGLPMGCEVKLEAVPDSEYSPEKSPPSGEILARGENVFHGYFKNKELSKQSMADGWFRTGDVGRLNPNGSLSVVDRIKSLFKLSQGEYISPETVEANYKLCKSINQIFVYGDSTKNCVVAVIVPEDKFAMSVIEEKSGLTEETMKMSENLRKSDKKEFVQQFEKFVGENREAIAEKVLSEMSKRNGYLRGFEKVCFIHIENRIDENMNGFTVENDCLTPSLKLRRMKLKKRYAEEIKELYAKADVKRP